MQSHTTLLMLHFVHLSLPSIVLRLFNGCSLPIVIFCQHPALGCFLHLVSPIQLICKLFSDKITAFIFIKFCNYHTVFFEILGAMQFNKGQTERAKEDVKKAMKVLNDHLLHHTFLVGERISLADIAVACTLLHLYQHVMDPNFR